MQGLHVPALVAVALLATAGTASAQADAAPTLPRPTGPFPVGRVTYHWTDTSRREVLAPDASARRELMIDVWYPAQPGTGSPAQYLPEFNALRRAVDDDALRREFGPAHEAVATGRVRTHTAENASFARELGRCPVLVFSHGFGVLSRLYSGQLEDLASHGYVVAAIAHTYETMVTVFPDGRSVPFASEAWTAATKTEEASIAYGNGRMRWWADDARFVLDQLAREDRRGPPRRAPFAGHLDLRRVGVFGHSSGGRAAALACRNDRRVKACLNQDGLAMKLPFDTGTIPGFAQPFLVFVRPPPPGKPTDEELAQMGLTWPALEALIRKLDAGQEAAMQSTGRGSYRVTLSMPGVSHMSFGDQPILQAAGDPGRTEQSVRNLETIRAYTRAFFDKSLRGARNTLLDRGNFDPTVKVESFPRHERPGP